MLELTSAEIKASRTRLTKAAADWQLREAENDDMHQRWLTKVQNVDGRLKEGGQEAPKQERRASSICSNCGIIQQRHQKRFAATKRHHGINIRLQTQKLKARKHAPDNDRVTVKYYFTLLEALIEHVRELLREKASYVAGLQKIYG